MGVEATIGAAFVIALVSAAASAGETASDVQVLASASAEAPSRDGTFTLEWSGGEEYQVELDAPGDGVGFQPWYEGKSTQSFVSGLPNGEASVRVRARSAGGAWSQWVSSETVVIEHHAMSKALGLMSLGFLVFAVIAIYIVIQSSRRET